MPLIFNGVTIDAVNVVRNGTTTELDSLVYNGVEVFKKQDGGEEEYETITLTYGDIVTMPAGTYNIVLAAGGNGGQFMIRNAVGNAPINTNNDRITLLNAGGNYVVSQASVIMNDVTLANATGSSGSGALSANPANTSWWAVLASVSGSLPFTGVVTCTNSFAIARQW